PTTGEISGTLTYDAAGSYSVDVTATDDGTPNLADTQTFTWTINNTNRAPIVGAIADQTNAENDVVAIAPTGSDPDGDALIWSATGLPDGLTIDPTTGAITGTLTYDAAGTTTVTITATDGTDPTSTSFDWTVNNTNRPPIVGVITDQTDAEADVISLTPTGSDPDGDTLTWSATGLPDGLTIDPVTGEISGTLTYDAAGTTTVTVTATDDGTPNLADTQTFTWTVTNTNRAPIVGAIADQTTAENDVISLTPTGSDPDGDAITWSATGLPDGLTINPTTGEISGTLSFTSAGTTTVTITATDGTDPTSTSFDWTTTNTNRPPVVTPITDQTNAEADIVSVTPTGSDPDGDAITWSATGLPDGLTIDPATGAITGTLTYDAAGTTTVTITATDPGTLDDSTTFDWTVTNTNRAPIVGVITDRTNAETDSIILNPIGSDPDGDALAWSATGLPDGLTIDPVTGATIGTLTYDAAGTTTVTITATDSGLLDDSTTFDWTITNTNRAPIVGVITDQTNAEADIISLTPTGSDPDGDTLTWTATGLPDGLAISPATGQITGTLTYDAAGTTTVTITATDGADPTNTSFDWTITNTNRAPIVGVITDQTNAENDVVLITPTGSDPDGDALTWTATGLPDGLTIDPVTGEITGTLTYDAAGTTTVTVTATDGTDPTNTSFDWTITNTNRPPVLAPIGLQLWSELDAVSLTPTATDPDGDTLTWSAVALPDGLSIDATTGEISGTLGYDSVRNIESTILVSDGSALASAFVDWSIANLNRPPVLINPGNQSSVVGSTVNFTVAASDPDGDTLTYAATYLLPGLTLDPTTGVVSGSPTAGAYGTGPVIFTVSDGTDNDAASITWDVTLPVPPAPTTSTTVPPTTTTTTSTTVAPTTTTTTVAPDEPTEALPFIDFRAQDDQVVVTAAERIVIDVRANDVGGENAQIIALSIPEFGELEVIDDQLILDMPAGFVGQFTFLYSVENERGEVSTAEVKVFAASSVSTGAIELRAAPVANATDVLRRFGSLVLQVLRIELTAAQLAAMLLAPFVFLLMRFLFGRRDDLVSVTSVAFGTSANATAETGVFRLRHDATVWQRRRGTRTIDGVAQVLVETPDGSAWIDADLVVDTGH
ncbi:MAG: hypothetical protein HKN94_08595, partial [Acidimicrobiales bacterium]|nr:hypothetical protein [Acidimicrobiales bacterium]